MANDDKFPPNDSCDVTEVQGTLVPVDRTLFFTFVKYFAENSLFEEFEDYLESQNSYELVLDVAFANHMKQFLLKSRRLDPIARLALMCSCGDGGGGGGGGSPSGVRG